MEKLLLMCKAGKRPAQCGFTCDSCFSRDVIYGHVCDKCGIELYDDECSENGEPEFCASCAGKIIKEAYYKENA